MLVSERNYARERSAEEKAETPYWQNPNIVTPQARQNDAFSKLYGGERVDIVKELEISQRIADEENNVDLAPTAKTRETVSSRSKQAVSLKGKVIMITYLVLFLALGLLILFTTLSIQSAIAEVGILSGTAAQAAREVEELNRRIEEGIDEDLLVDLVSQVGLAPPAESQTNYYGSAEVRGEQKYVIEKNWFDAICNFFSGAFK